MTFQAGGDIQIADFTGMIIAWPTNTAPTGFLLCDGTSYLRTDYAALFTLIGTTYGAVDGTHFTVPNMKGKVIVGRDAAQTEFDVLAETGGEKTHTLDTTEIPAHSHSVSGIATTNTASNDFAQLTALSGASVTTSSTGGGQPTTTYSLTS